jgi:hypothetical protein
MNRRTLFRLFLLSYPCCTLAPLAAQESVKAEKPREEGLRLEYLDFEQRLYSASRRSEVGKETLLDMTALYSASPATDLRFRIDIDPVKYPGMTSKTSRFEFRLTHRYEKLEIQGDFDLNGDDSSRGATSAGVDRLSDDSFLSYHLTDSLKLSFYPYNIGTEVGAGMLSGDVGRVYEIEGTPSALRELPVEDEKLTARATPGFGATWQFAKNLSLSAAAGATSVHYPTDASFDIEREGTGSAQWSVRDVYAYRGAVTFNDSVTKVTLQHTAASNSRYSGALMQSASSLQLASGYAGLALWGEMARSENGSKPYQLNGAGSWFNTENGYRPVYADRSGRHQDWIGKKGYAMSVKAGYAVMNLLPFLQYNYYDKYYVFSGRESAHKLRTGDGRSSHGGLSVVTLGTHYNSSGFVITPSLDILAAQNAVFSNYRDVRDDAMLADLSKNDKVLKLNVGYQLP